MVHPLLLQSLRPLRHWRQAVRIASHFEECGVEGAIGVRHAGLRATATSAATTTARGAGATTATASRLRSSRRRRTCGRRGTSSTSRSACCRGSTTCGSRSPPTTAATTISAATAGVPDAGEIHLTVRHARRRTREIWRLVRIPRHVRSRIRRPLRADGRRNTYEKSDRTRDPNSPSHHGSTSLTTDLDVWIWIITVH